ncbi:MAG: ABC transporter ATP-binding protein [Deltaproteobacteria bacterium]|nr:ABC transporter ATP-binding protein [Deltaproteobacteria bacterium]
MTQPATGATLLEARDLSKHFGGLRAVASISFRVRQGEIVGVIGPNGAGKTTLFALLSGFLPATSGEVLFEDAPILGLRPDTLCHLGMARTFQVVRPFPEMTVFENVKAAAVFGKQGRRSNQEILSDVEEVLRATGLAPLAGQHPPSLSLPQRKRLEVARALATRPKLLLLDEVLAGLNPKEIQEALPFIRSLNEKHRVTILMIEHNLRAIMGVCQRILVLNFGQLIFDGAPSDAVEDARVIEAYLGGQQHA